MVIPYERRALNGLADDAAGPWSADTSLAMNKQLAAIATPPTAYRATAAWCRPRQAGTNINPRHTMAVIAKDDTALQSVTMPPWYAGLISTSVGQTVAIKSQLSTVSSTVPSTSSA